MKISVVCFGGMREYLPETVQGNRCELDLGEEATVGDAVDTMGAPRRLVHAVLVDGTRGGLDSALHEGAEVTLMPPFAGGSWGPIAPGARAASR